MKVIFLKDHVPHGRAGDVREVKNGFGRNYLLPRRIAALATKAVMQRAESLRAAAEERRLKEAQSWREIGDSLASEPVVVPMRAGPTGRLYGSVTPAALAAQLSEMIERPIDRRGIRFPAPIRELGEYSVPVRLFEDVSVTLRIVVKAEGEEEDEAPAPAPDDAGTEAADDSSPAPEDTKDKE